MSPDRLTVGHGDAFPASCVELLFTFLLISLDVAVVEVVKQRSERPHLINGTRPRGETWKEGHSQDFVPNRRAVRRATDWEK
jgi:hypothetical protein